MAKLFTIIKGILFSGICSGIALWLKINLWVKNMLDQLSLNSDPVIITLILASGLGLILLYLVEHYIFNKKQPKHFRRVIELVSKCNCILKNEIQQIAYNKELVKNYWSEFEEGFKTLLDIPEISQDKHLFQLIQNAENRFKVVLGMAESVCFDTKKLEKALKFGNSNITSLALYLKESKPIIDQFVEEKESIFQYCK